MNFTKTRNIYLIRHCQPYFENGIHRCIGKMDIPLSHEGIVQAKYLAEYFSKHEINQVFSSNLKRARETAEIIAGNNFEVIIKDRFSELDTGKWDGLSFEEIKHKFPREYEERGNDLENYVVEGGESMAACRKRAMEELNNTIDGSNGNIIIITHAGVIRTILSSILDIDIKETFHYKIKYGSISLLNANDRRSFSKIGFTTYKEI